VDRAGISLLMYAAASNELDIAKELLSCREHVPDRGRISRDGIPSLGIVGHWKSLHFAMAFASCEMVRVLLEHGEADPCSIDVVGCDPLMIASATGRVENITYWLKRFPNWNLERRNTVLGSYALSNVTFFGPRRIDIVKILLHHGARLTNITFDGGSLLISTCESEDSEPEFLNLLLKKNKDLVNFRTCGQTFLWRTIHRVARVCIEFFFLSMLERSLFSLSLTLSLHLSRYVHNIYTHTHTNKHNRYSQSISRSQTNFFIDLQ